MFAADVYTDGACIGNPGPGKLQSTPIGGKYHNRLCQYSHDAKPESGASIGDLAFPTARRKSRMNRRRGGRKSVVPVRQPAARKRRPTGGKPQLGRIALFLY